MKICLIRTCGLFFLTTLLLFSTSQPVYGQPGRDGQNLDDNPEMPPPIFACCFGTALIIIVGIPVSIVGIGWAIFVFVSLYNAFSAISPQNRDMEPAEIFLMLIPFFGIVWYFFVVLRLASSLEKELSDPLDVADAPAPVNFRRASSLEKEYDELGPEVHEDFGKLLGILAIIPLAGPVLQLLWILKIRRYTAELANAGGLRMSREHEDDQN